MKQVFCIVCLVLCLSSCDFIKAKTARVAVARVNDNYLYASELDAVIPEGTSKTDSALIANAYIERWARQLLLMDGALLNLSDTKQEAFLKLVKQYKSDLYTKAYLEGLVQKSIDTIVDSEAAKVFYEANKESFKLNDDLLQFRYISLPLNPVNRDTITKRFKRFTQSDKRYLDSIAVQFKSYALNDSLWVKYSHAVQKIPVVNLENKNQLLKKTNFIELKDSINLYLMQINNVRSRNDYAPLDYVIPSIKQIVINKRKLELIKQLENDITKDAIANKQFEIYN